LPFLFKGGYLKSGETTHGESRYGPGKQKRYTEKELKNMHENGAFYKPVETGTKKQIHTFLCKFLYLHLDLLRLFYYWIW
jgi:hypothetical protein